MSSTDENPTANEAVTAPDFQQLYPWISKEFFERIIRRDQIDDTIVVAGYTIKAALGQGENYASQMLRVRVEYSRGEKSTATEHLSLIIKATLTNNAKLEEMVSDLGAFKKEIIAFQKLIPEVERRLRAIGDDTRLAAKCYDVSEEKSYLVFEDLTPAGYRNVDRRIGLGVKHLVKVMEKVAKWHAGTAVLVDEDYSFTNDLLDQPVDEKSAIWRTMIDNCSTTLIQYAEQERNDRLAETLTRRHKTVFNDMCAAWKRNDAAFNVICHGDMWSNNVLFRHEDDQVADAILCDFQILHYSAPMTDVSHMLFSSSEESLRDADWDRVIQRYHEVLTDTLRKLGYTKPVPTLMDLHVDMLHKGSIDAYMAPVMVGIRKLDDHSEDVMGHFFQNEKENQAYRLGLISRPQCKNSIEYIFDYAHRKGMLE